IPHLPASSIEPISSDYNQLAGATISNLSSSANIPRTAMPEIKKYLSVAVLGAHRDRLAYDLIQAIAHRGCEILECRITPLGSHFSASMLLAGNWSAMGRMESALPGLADYFDLSIQFEHTRMATPSPESRPYAAEVIAP